MFELYISSKTFGVGKAFIGLGFIFFGIWGSIVERQYAGTFVGTSHLDIHRLVISKYIRFKLHNVVAHSEPNPPQ